MNIQWLTVALFGLSGAVSGVVTAEPLGVKPGLWEMIHVSEISGMPAIPPEAMARMTPEQRARIEQALAAHAGAPTTQTRQSCVTKDKLERPFAPDARSGKDCKHTVVSSSSRKQEIHMECNGRVKSSGDLRIEAITPENIKGDFHMVSGDPAHPMNVRMNIVGKWLGADCGKLAEH
ncbi:DUF3617 domain-containing protein [Undibacterium arcticum]|uniref:DUF3617 domain-containing protein n=1 Tax=Undibacterium arcticum TaxID=1762892 RepID=A0ABV7EZY5_9BURK